MSGEYPVIPPRPTTPPPSVERESIVPSVADDILLMGGWQRMLVAPANILHDTRELYLPELFDVQPTPLDLAPQTAHLCKHCHSLQSGMQLDEFTWLCGSCRKIAPY